MKQRIKWRIVRDALRTLGASLLGKMLSGKGIVNM